MASIRGAGHEGPFMELSEVVTKDEKIKFLKEQLNQLANFNPDWDMLEAAQGSLRDHMALLKTASAEVRNLTIAVREVFDGRDHNTGCSSGQVFVDHGSLMVLMSLVNAIAAVQKDSPAVIQP